MSVALILLFVIRGAFDLVGILRPSFVLEIVYACLVGLIGIVMLFANANEPWAWIAILAAIVLACKAFLDQEKREQAQKEHSAP